MKRTWENIRWELAYELREARAAVMKEPTVLWPIRLLWRLAATLVVSALAVAVFWYVSGILVVGVLNPVLKLNIADYEGQAALSNHLEILASGVGVALIAGAGFVLWLAALNFFERSRYTRRRESTVSADTSDDTEMP